MKRVLVVEDEASIREMVALNLKMAGWEVLEAHSAERALELIQKNPPCDVALLDIMLPGMDGSEILKEIRKKSNAPVIMVTARDSIHDQLLNFANGADDYITKPYALAIVKVHISQS